MYSPQKLVKALVSLFSLGGGQYALRDASRELERECEGH